MDEVKKVVMDRMAAFGSKGQCAADKTLCITCSEDGLRVYGSQDEARGKDCDLPGPGGEDKQRGPAEYKEIAGQNNILAIKDSACKQGLFSM